MIILWFELNYFYIIFYYFYYGCVFMITGMAYICQKKEVFSVLPSIHADDTTSIYLANMYLKIIY